MTDLRLNCFILGDESCCVFPVKISPDKTISNLRRDIRADYTRRENDTIVNLELYQVDISTEEEDLANVQLPPKEERLKVFKLVRDYWTTPEGIQRDRVHILVKAEVIQKPVLSPEVPVRGKRPREEEGHNESIENFKRARISYCKGLARHSASMTKQEKFIQQQQGKDCMLNGRPRKHTGPPIVLYHPVFGNFLSNLQSSDPLNPDFEKQVLEYLWASQEIYNNRDDSIRDALETLLGQSWELSEDAPDTAAINAAGGYSTIMEILNEIGTDENDPSIEAAQSYSRLWQTSNLFDRCCCPTILIAIAGPWMCILGAVFLDRPIIQPLTDYMWVGSNPSKPKEIRSVARVFHCVLEAQTELQAYYSDIASQDPQSLCPPPFPYPSHFITDDEEQVDFDYLSALEPLGLDADSSLKPSQSQIIPDKLVFLAKLRNTKPPTRVVVKFVESYNSDAHKLLAEQGLAPKLLYDGTADESRRLGPDYYMIVMEYVNGVDLGHCYDPTIPLCVGQDVERALSILHDANIVFGDLRSPNVMLVKDTDVKITGAKLIDFDWCAKHMEGRYPLDLNVNGNVNWAEGVWPGELMKKEHDNVMREYLFVLRKLV